MTFYFDKSSVRAIDSDSRVELYYSSKFYDESDKFYFVYKGVDIEFQFFVRERREVRDVLVKGEFVERNVVIATVISESSIKSGLEGSLGCKVDDYFYKKVRDNVFSGVSALVTWGGDVYKFVPDYQVEFV